MGNRRELKSGRNRSFPIHADLLAVLERLPRRDGYVFRGPRGGRLKPDTVRRILIRDVIEPLAEFPATGGGIGLVDGRLHSFRHYFCSTCANSGVPERIVMEEARRRMDDLDFLGGAGGPSVGDQEDNVNKEETEPPPSESGETGRPD